MKTNSKNLKITLFALILLVISFCCIQSFSTANSRFIIANAENVDFGSNTQLENYLKEINTQATLDENSFASVTSLSFLGTNATANQIYAIENLHQFKWDNLETIQIDGLDKIELLNLVGIVNNCGS